MSTPTATATEARLRKGIHLELRALETTDSLGMMRGTAVPYRTPEDVGFYTEEFAPGSLAKSIKESARALPLLLFHDDVSFPIGSASEWHDTERTLDGVWKLDTGDVAQRAARLAKDGHLTGLSIRFQPIRSTWTWVEDWSPELGAKDAVVREEARLVETSLVSTPAYQAAGVQWVRTAEGRHRDVGAEAREWLEWVAKMRA